VLLLSLAALAKMTCATATDARPQKRYLLKRKSEVDSNPSASDDHVMDANQIVDEHVDNAEQRRISEAERDSTMAHAKQNVEPDGDDVNPGAGHPVPELAVCGGEFVHVGDSPRSARRALQHGDNTDDDDDNGVVEVPEVKQVRRIEWSEEKEAERPFTAVAATLDEPAVFTNTPYVSHLCRPSNAHIVCC
jgi:hypothetical protein